MLLILSLYIKISKTRYSAVLGNSDIDQVSFNLSDAECYFSASSAWNRAVGHGFYI